MAYKYSYKELKNVSLREIHAKYAIPELNLVQFKNRIYNGTMSMKEALTLVPEQIKKFKPQNRYMDELFNKLEREEHNKITVNKATFNKKLQEGEPPKNAIRSNRSKKDISAYSQIHTLKQLEKTAIQTQNKKDYISALKRAKKAKVLNKIEKKYIKDTDILNAAFGLCQTKKI